MSESEKKKLVAPKGLEHVEKMTICPYCNISLSEDERHTVAEDSCDGTSYFYTVPRPAHLGGRI